MSNGQTHSSLKRWLVALVILLIGFAVIRLLPSFLLNIWISRNHSPVEISRATAFLDAPVNIPLEWSKPPNPSAQASQLRKKLARQFGSDEKLAAAQGSTVTQAIALLAGGTALSGTDWGDVGALVRRTSPFTDTFLELVTAPDYVHDSSGYPTEMQGACRLAVLRAYLAAHDGNEAEATSVALAVLKAARCHPAAPDIAHLVTAGWAATGAEALNAISRGTTSSEELHRRLDALKTLEPQLARPVEDSRTLGLIASLRDLKARGAGVDLSSGRTGGELLAQRIDGPRLLLEARLKSIKPGSPEYLELQKQIKDAEHIPLGDFRVPRWVVTARLRLLMTWLRMAQTGEMPMVGVGRANMRLAQADIAARLYALDHGTSITAAAQLVPQYVQTIPEDPFSSAPLKFDAAKARFYSIGPDRQDGGGRMRYDAQQPATGRDIFVGE